MDGCGRLARCVAQTGSSIHISEFQSIWEPSSSCPRLPWLLVRSASRLISPALLTQLSSSSDATLSWMTKVATTGD